MQKLLVLFALLLIAGGGFWLFTSPDSSASQQGLQQAGSNAKEGTKALAASTLEAPDSQTRERSNQGAARSIETTPAVTEAALREGPEEFTEVIGEPAATFTVSAFIVNWEKNPMTTRELTLGYEALPRSSESIDKRHAQYELVTDAEGRLQVTLTLPDPELKQIAIWVEDKTRQAQGWVEPVQVIAGGRGDLGTIRIFETRESFPTPLVEGQVLSEDGQVVPDCSGSISSDQEDDSGDFKGALPSRVKGQVVIDSTGHFLAFGPSSWERATMSFNAKGFLTTFAYVSKIPKSGLQLTLNRRLRLKGKLLVPAHGPRVHEYGIWLSQKGMGLGISPNSDGTFSGVGTNQSLDVKVTHPSLGVELFIQEFLMAPTEGAGLGTIDLRDLVQVLDFVVVDGEGVPLENQKLSLSAPGMKTLGGSFETDEKGRLLTVVPIGIGSIFLTRNDKDPENPSTPVEVDLTASPSEVRIP